MIIDSGIKKYHSKNSKVFSCQYHCIFSPKYSRKVLINGIDIRLKEIISNLEKEFPFSILEMEIMPDHVHLLIDCDPDFGISNAIKKIKGSSAKILRDEFPELKRKLPCLWTRSKFISSVGSVSLEVVKKYIEGQKNV
jgi:putative transposase